MRSLTIEARNLDSARGLCEALAAFRPTVAGSDADGYFVAVDLNGSDHAVTAVLHVLEQYVAARSHEPARVELDGRRYTLDAE